MRSIDDSNRREYEAECFLCRETAHRVVIQEGSIYGIECNCGTVYATPQETSNQAGDSVDSHDETFYSYPAKFKAKWIVDHCPQGSLVEVGAGFGALLHEVQKYGYKVQAMEPQKNRADYVQENLGIPVDVNYLESHNLTNSFDVVYHCDLLSHFVDPISALSTMQDLLVPDGVLCFEVGIIAGFSPWWYPLIGKVGLTQHRWLYSQRSLEELLRQSNLKIVTTKRFGLAPQVILSRSAQLAYRLFRRLLLRKRGGRFPNALYKLDSFLRYQVGAISPNIGPQTLLIIAKPLNYKESTGKPNFDS